MNTRKVISCYFELVRVLIQAEIRQVHVHVLHVEQIGLFVVGLKQIDKGVGLTVQNLAIPSSHRYAEILSTP